MTIWTPRVSPHNGNLSQGILDQLATDVRSGRLASGTPLPTQRVLAEKLGVSLGTVTRAYNMGREQGLLSATTGRGTYVAQQHYHSANEGVVNLSQNYFLRESLDPGVRSLLARMGEVPPMVACLDHYLPYEGLLRHREVLARWLSRPDWKVDPEQVVITCGAQHGIFLLLMTLAARGETVLAESMTYTGVKSAATALGLNLQGVEMDEQGIRPDALESACKKTKARLLYVVPTLQNPTGAVMGVARRQEIAKVARRLNLNVIEDDVYGFLLEDPPPPLARLLPDRCYFINSLSKSVAPGLRFGFAVAPRAAAPRLADGVRAMTLEAPSFAVEVGCRWISDGTAARVARWKREEARERWDQARAILGGFAVGGSHSSGHLWLHLPDAWRPASFTARLQALGVLVSPAEAFATNPSKAPNAVRICLGAEASRERLVHALHLIAGVLRQLPAHSAVVT